MSYFKSPLTVCPRSGIVLGQTVLRFDAATGSPSPIVVEWIDEAGHGIGTNARTGGLSWHTGPLTECPPLHFVRARNDRSRAPA
jgi:hypothetical protein